LEALIAETPDNPLLASLNLSLERLDDEARQWLPRLGVFQGGAMESNLVAISGYSEAQWQKLRPALEATGLIQLEHLAGMGVPYLNFHPTLAPALWSPLSSEEQAELITRHRLRYYLVSGYLYREDKQHAYQVSAIAQRELPNLMYAVHGALDAGEAWGVEFVNNVNKFLEDFGLNRDRAVLNQLAKPVGGEVGSRSWYVVQSNLGNQLYSLGRYQEAVQVFTEVLFGLGEQPSYERCIILGQLGLSFYAQGQAAKAEKYYRQGLTLAQQLEPSDTVKRQKGVLQINLADVLRDVGNYGEARIAYETALTIFREQNDDRAIGAVEGQLGTLAMLQGNFTEAARRNCEALLIFQQLNQPAMEAVAWHQLGIVYEKAKQWDAAEQAYREAARIHESQGNLTYASQTWNQLGTLNQIAGKSEEAEAWYRKAIDGGKTAGDKLGVSKRLNNLADLLLLQDQPDCLKEAQQLAEEALAIKQTLDPFAAEIWKIHNTLAKIADKQQDTNQAKEYRRLSREAWMGFAGAEYHLQKHWRLIAAVVTGVDDAEVRQQQEPVLAEWAKAGWNNLVPAIHQVLEGERDEDVLCEQLAGEEAAIINAILRGIADPETLKPLLEGQE
jgi:tetratricopeptide (TPR) repeat protein